MKPEWGNEEGSRYLWLTVLRPRFRVGYVVRPPRTAHYVTARAPRLRSMERPEVSSARHGNQTCNFVSRCELFDACDRGDVSVHTRAAINDVPFQENAQSRTDWHQIPICAAQSIRRTVLDY